MKLILTLLGVILIVVAGLAPVLAMLWRASKGKEIPGLIGEIRRLGVWVVLSSQVRVVILSLGLTVAMNAAMPAPNPLLRYASWTARQAARAASRSGRIAASGGSWATNPRTAADGVPRAPAPASRVASPRETIRGPASVRDWPSARQEKKASTCPA